MNTIFKNILVVLGCYLLGMMVNMGLIITGNQLIPFAASYHMILAICIGIFFLLGGISMVFIMPAPVWFIVADLSLAYIPMGWFGWKLSGQKK